MPFASRTAIGENLYGELPVYRTYHCSIMTQAIIFQSHSMPQMEHGPQFEHRPLLYFQPIVTITNDSCLTPIHPYIRTRQYNIHNNSTSREAQIQFGRRSYHYSSVGYYFIILLFYYFIGCTSPWAAIRAWALIRENTVRQSIIAGMHNTPS